MACEDVAVGNEIVLFLFAYRREQKGQENDENDEKRYCAEGEYEVSAGA